MRGGCHRRDPDASFGFTVYPMIRILDFEAMGNNPLAIRFCEHPAFGTCSAWFYMNWGKDETMFGGITRRDGAPNDWIESAMVAYKRGIAIWSKGLIRFLRSALWCSDLKYAMKQLEIQGKTE